MKKFFLALICAISLLSCSPAERTDGHAIDGSCNYVELNSAFSFRGYTYLELYVSRTGHSYLLHDPDCACHKKSSTSNSLLFE